MIKPRTVVTGLVSYLPGALALYERRFLRPNPTSASASYGIFFKHLLLARASGMQTMPRTVVELGPGLTLGVGLASLICGAERYVALDVVPFADRAQTLPLFDELVTLFRQGARPQNLSGFPNYERLWAEHERLHADGWPFKTSGAATTSSADRLARLRTNLAKFASGQEQGVIDYRAPWLSSDSALNGLADWLMSHTVLQHVDDLPAVWQAIGRMLAPHGYTTHQVNFDSHGTCAEWNGHWGCPEWLWRVALGRKKFLINRLPVSAYRRAIERAGLVAADLQCNPDEAGMQRSELVGPWRELTEEDLRTHGAFIVGKKQAIR